jgi:hypothetical protein
MSKRVRAMVTVIMCVLLCIVAVNAMNKQETEVNNTVNAEAQVYNTTYLEQWCGEATGTIRMVGAWITEDGYVEDETGNVWEVEYESAPSANSFLLLWIDDNSTPNYVQDDVIVKTWVEVY